MGAISFSIDQKLLALLTRELPIKTFVETGTFKGESLQIARSIFPDCYSIELSQEYYQAAVRHFAGQTGVHLLHGESPVCLRDLREKLQAIPTLFWLDAHWCVAENTAGDTSQSPLLGELRAIGSLHPQSVVLIDDARLYLCPPPAPHRANDWPDFHSIIEALAALNPTHRFMVWNDVIAFYPLSLQSSISKFAHDTGVDWLQISLLAHEYQMQGKMKHERRERVRNLLNPFRARK